MVLIIQGTILRPLARIYGNGSAWKPTPTNGKSVKHVGAGFHARPKHNANTSLLCSGGNLFLHCNLYIVH